MHFIKIGGVAVSYPTRFDIPGNYNPKRFLFLISVTLKKLRWILNAPGYLKKTANRLKPGCFYYFLDADVMHTMRFYLISGLKFWEVVI
jgi:hypothetical protein